MLTHLSWPIPNNVLVCLQVCEEFTMIYNKKTRLNIVPLKIFRFKKNKKKRKSAVIHDKDIISSGNCLHNRTNDTSLHNVHQRQLYPHSSALLPAAAPSGLVYRWSENIKYIYVTENTTRDAASLLTDCSLWCNGSEDGPGISRRKWIEY